MLSVNFILYVTDLEKSAAFYSRLFKQTPVPFDAPFVMFFLESGEQLGLVRRETRDTSADTRSSGFELTFPVGQKADVDRLYREWQDFGVTIVDPPHALPFAYNFLATDPDGHRLRVFSRHMAG